MLISEKTMFALNDISDLYIESASELLGYKYESPQSGIGRKRIITFAIAAALVISMGTAVYAIGEIMEYIRIKNNHSLSIQSEQGAKDIEQFTGEEIELKPGEYALYLDNEKGQSGTTNFDYFMDKSNQKLHISYYDSGEVNMVDARALFKLDFTPYSNELEWFEAVHPDRDEYKLTVIEAIPGLVDALNEDGWIKHTSDDIDKADILNIHLFWDTYVQMRVLMVDGSAYELWLEPESLAPEGFMYWNSQDAKVIRNGFFAALKEDRLEAWWEELQAQPSLG